jgi:hypothetical protein
MRTFSVNITPSPATTSLPAQTSGWTYPPVPTEEDTWDSLIQSRGDIPNFLSDFVLFKSLWQKFRGDNQESASSRDAGKAWQALGERKGEWHTLWDRLRARRDRVYGPQTSNVKNRSARATKGKARATVSPASIQ